MAGLLRSPFWLRSRILLWQGGRTSMSRVSAPIPSAVLRSCSNVPNCKYLIYPARLFTIAAQEKREIQEQPPFPIHLKQMEFFDKALNKMEASIRRNGCITKSLLLNIFHDFCRTGFPNSNQALLLLRSCGSLLPELPPPERTALAHNMWAKLKNMGVVFDVSHYNALLKVYLQNEHAFSPAEFLTEMEEAKVHPNRVTYQRLIAAYCSQGDIDGSSNILSIMKSKDLPITELIFSTLVTGHAKSGDMENATNIFSVMRDAEIEPGPETYTALLNAYAEKGDINRIEEELRNIEKAEIHLFDRDFMDIIFTFAKAGYPQYIQNIMEKMKFDRGILPDAKNLCLRLITLNLEDTAFQVLKSFFVALDISSDQGISHGNFFLHHCINIGVPLAKLKYFCDELKANNLHSTPLLSSLQFALEGKKADVAIDIMKLMKEEGSHLKPHYFWPLLVQHQKEKNTEGITEVLKAMDELEVQPNVETYLTYVFADSDNLDSIRHLMQEKGCPTATPDFFLAEIRHEAIRNRLDKVYELLSSSNIPPVDMNVIKSSLVLGFRRSMDVYHWSKITELLYTDERYYQEPLERTEAVGYFLYTLIDSMTDSEVQDKEEQLRQYFHQLQNMNVVISPNIFRRIHNLLNQCNVPRLLKFFEVEPSNLENKLEQLKAQNQPIRNVLKQLIVALCSEKNMQKALEVKAEYESDMDGVGYEALIRLCCQNDNVEEAMNLKEEFCRKDSSVAFEASSYLDLVRILGKYGRLEEAINILKEMKEKGVWIKESTATSFFHILNSVALQGEVETLNRLHETIVDLDLLKPTGNLCSPLITVHLKRDDLPMAVEVLFDCYKKYGVLPRLHDILCSLIEKGNTEIMQKVIEFLTQERGEMAMIYDLFFAFLRTGKYKEAKKIIETPGLRARPDRLEWFASKCIANDQGDSLETMVELTQKLFDCDRDEMYYYLLTLYKKQNDWIKADAVWTKIQEENIVPRPRTLQLLAHVFKANNQEIPFGIPETWYEGKGDSTPSGLSLLPAQTAYTERKILQLCKKGNPEEAYRLFLKEKDILKTTCYSALIKALLSNGLLEEAINVKKIAETHIKGFVLNDAASSLLILTQVRRDYLKDAISTLESLLEKDRVPIPLAVTRLVQSLAQKGDIESINKVEKMVKTLHKSLRLSQMLFINNTVLAHIKNNNLDAATEYLEENFTSGALTPNANISFVFRKLMEGKEETALEKLSAMSEKLANQFGIYMPITNLFLQYIVAGRVDDAKLLLQRHKAIGEQKGCLVSFVTQKAKTQGQSKTIETLWELVPDFSDREFVYSYLMKSHSVGGDVVSAKALYEKMKAENVAIDELTLKRLAKLLKQFGEPVPFTEPPESFSFYAEKLKNEQQSYSSDED